MISRFITVDLKQLKLLADSVSQIWCAASKLILILGTLILKMKTPDHPIVKFFSTQTLWIQWHILVPANQADFYYNTNFAALCGTQNFWQKRTVYNFHQISQKKQKEHPSLFTH